MISISAPNVELKYPANEQSTLSDLQRWILGIYRNVDPKILVLQVGSRERYYFNKSNSMKLIECSNKSFFLRILCLGGKGGFGSQLKAVGGQMSKRKNKSNEENLDSCRDLQGRRIGVVKRMKEVETRKLLEKQILDERRKKLEQRLVSKAPSVELSNDFFEELEELKDSVRIALGKKSNPKIKREKVELKK